MAKNPDLRARERESSTEKFFELQSEARVGGRMGCKFTTEKTKKIRIKVKRPLLEQEIEITLGELFPRGETDFTFLNYHDIDDRVDVEIASRVERSWEFIGGRPDIVGKKDA